jgi:hypothetical protein
MALLSGLAAGEQGLWVHGGMGYGLRLTVHAWVTGGTRKRMACVHMYIRALRWDMDTRALAAVRSEHCRWEDGIER